MPPARAAATPALEPIGVRFDPNMGQLDASVEFVARAPGYTVYLSPRETVISVLAVEQPARREARPPRVLDSRSVRLRWLGSDPNARGHGEAKLGSVANYLIGDDPNGWVQRVPHYAAVRYASLWEGIDVRFYASGDDIEYDLVVGPGADPGAIRMRVEGADTVSIADDGRLVLTAGSHTIQQSLPAIY